jgi:hypothetical protein
MANTRKALEILDAYFKTKGHVLNSQEYSHETDVPIRLQQVRNIFGSWNRLEKLLMAKDRIEEEGITDLQGVLDARNKAANDARNQWIEASENQDAKALREAEAQHSAEILALNAATPEGANANKIAIGGPLPGEQPKYERQGAPVNIDPVTKERTVTKINPELFHPVAGDGLQSGLTPRELVAAVAAKRAVSSGSIEVGHATDGGSQGQPSIDTVNAIGAAAPGATTTIEASTVNKA